MRGRGAVAASVVALAAASACAAAEAAAQSRVRRSIDGPVTREAIVRGLSVVPDADPGSRAETSVMLHIEFDFNSAELTASARRDLDRVASALADARLADGSVTVEGHTDASGSEEYNRRLSRQRATAVTSYLVERGVAALRLSAVGFGEERLLTEYQPTDRRQRRVEIVRTW